MAKLWDLIKRSATNGIRLQNDDGSMPVGHNGPHKDPDTPVRNTAHWTISFLKSYEYTENEDFRKAAIRAADYLISKNARPMNAAFWCRKNPEKDFSNGLIGQAWAIEALAQSFNRLKIPIYGKIAEEVFLLHPFNENLGLWRGVNVDGSHGPINLTFNQQLWFATCGAMLNKNGMGESNEIMYRVNKFLVNLPKNLDVYKNGLIGHMVHDRDRYSKILRNIYQKDPLLHQRNIGYHSFNLYAFSLLKKEIGIHDYDFWNSPEFKKTIQYATSKSYLKELNKNIYAYSYNPIGFEVGFALEVFSEDILKKNINISKWVNEQLRRHFSAKEELMIKDTADPNTLAARIYEATRLPNIEIDIEG